jgi:hypothetical protein
MRVVFTFAIAVLLGAVPAVSQNGVFVSVRAPRAVPLNTNPALSFWQDAIPVFLETSALGEPHPRYKTEVRSRWTPAYLYFLFVCPYDVLYLRPNPRTASETYALWNWDVAEVFLGSDFANIRRYREFEISPQGEWIDLDIDLARPHHEDGWVWNSGFNVAARVDPIDKIWYGAMRIPFASIGSRAPAPNETFRINLFRTEGPPSQRIDVVWQPTLSHIFHVPEKFGLLRLSSRANR